MGDATINLKPPGREWEVLGEDVYAGLLPRGLRVGADSWGFATVGFELPRDPDLPQPDLSSFVPCVIDEGPARLFEGKVMETPSRGAPDRAIIVNGRGYQYALDENPIEYAFKHARLADWRDVRSLPGYDPAIWWPGGQVTAGDGGIEIGAAKGTSWLQYQCAGVYIDLGPDVHIHKIELGLTQLGLTGHAESHLYVRGRIDDQLGDGAFGGTGQAGSVISAKTVWSDAIKWEGGSLVTGHYTGYFKPAARTIAILLTWNNATPGGTAAVDQVAQISYINLYSDRAYAGGGNGTIGRGILRGSDIVQRAVELGAPQIIVPQQSNDWRMIDELWALSHGGEYPDVIRGALYRIRNVVPSGNPTPRLAPWWDLSAVGAGLLTEAGPPTYLNAGGPLKDNDAPSAYAELGDPVTNALLWRALSYNGAFAISFFFRTTAAGDVQEIPNWRTLTGYIVAATNSAAAPAAGTMDWGVGISSLGLQFGYGNDVLSLTGRISTSGTGLRPNDGEWHHLLVSFDNEQGNLEVTLDGYSGWADEISASMGGDIGFRRAASYIPVFGNRPGADRRMRVDVAEIHYWHGPLPPAAGAHIFRAARKPTPTPLKRTLLPMPALATTAPRTARETADSIQAYHRYVAKIGRGRELQFHPQPTVPRYQVTAAASRRFENASLNAGDQAYNRALVVGQTEAGRPIRVERTAAHQPGAIFEKPPAVALVNPSFDSGVASSWDAAGTPSSDGAVFDTAPYSGKLLVGTWTAGARSRMWTSFFGRFLRGRLYQLRIRLRHNTAAAVGLPIRGTWGHLGENDWVDMGLQDIGFGSVQQRAVWGAQGAWIDLLAYWVPERDWIGTNNYSAAAAGTEPILELEAPTDDVTFGADFWLDSIDLRVGVNHVLDRQDDLRTRIIEISQPINAAIGRQIADTFLQSRARTQLRGSIEVGRGDLAYYATGDQAHPRDLAENTTELVHLPTLVDPDTGATGRDGQIVDLSYDPATERATLSIDNTRDNFEAAMQRFGLFTGSDA